MLRRLFFTFLVLWAGSLWSLAAWVAPVQFAVQSDRHIAGLVAARLFGIEAYLGLILAGLALLQKLRRAFALGYAAAALLAVNEWVLKPVMIHAQAAGSAAGLSFAAWHGVSAIIYLLACAAVLLVWLQAVHIQFAEHR